MKFRILIFTGVLLTASGCNLVKPANQFPPQPISYPPPPTQPPLSSSPSAAKSCSYTITALEKQVLDELNLARTQPAQYAALIAQNSNSATAQEAMAELRNLRPLPALSFSQCLARAAQDHVKDIGPKGIVGHDGSDGSNPSTRIQRYVPQLRGYSENISFGMNTGRAVILQLIIDENVPSRGHRKNIFDTKSQSVGISCGTHAKYQIMCVQDFAFERVP